MIAQIFSFPLELKRRRAANDFKSRNLHQKINDLLRHTVRKVLLILLLLMSTNGRTAIDLSLITAVLAVVPCF